MAAITTQARRLTRQHNNDEDLVSGYIYLVDIAAGRIVSAYHDPGPEAPAWMRVIQPYATWAAETTQEMRDKGYTLLRVGHGRITEKYAQRLLDGEVKG